MDTQFGPNAVDEPNLLYKLHRKIKVFNTTNPLPNRGYNLVANASKYGLVFIGSPDGTLSVYNLKDLINIESEAQHISVQLQEKPTHIAVNCDNELLSITGGQFINIYKIIDFQNQNTSPTISIKCEVNLSTYVSSLQWNPCIPDVIALAFFDGTLLICQVNNVQVTRAQTKARCICWSPKGKQLVVGNNDGSLCQYKPDLSVMKIISAPKLFDGAPLEALAIHWISTYQFAVVYKNAAGSGRPAVTIVNTPKGGQPTCLNYEDICFSNSSSTRPYYYYLLGLAQWNLIMSSSSKSMEIATLGSADGANWFQWSQTDEARPELPLVYKTQENYPVGLCVDTCAIHQLPWGENETLPPMPLLHVLSHSGLLITFNIINLNKQMPQICTPPQQLTLPVAALTGDIPDNKPEQVTMPAPAPPKQTPFAPSPFFQPQLQVPLPQNTEAPSVVASVTQFSTLPAQSAPTLKPLPLSQGVTLAQTSQMPPMAKPAIPPQEQTPLSTMPTKEPAKPQTLPENEALKAEQERLNQIKVNEELKQMLISEVNEFQTELYLFLKKSNETTGKLQKEINTIDSTYDLKDVNVDSVKSESSVEELQSLLIQLKRELVRACAAVAEARTYSETKELHEWTQSDPLTTKRVASVKSLSYYVQNQLEQAHNALDYKWNQMISSDTKFNKPGNQMTHPILEDVYQPLVKQQEILARQQAVVKTLNKTLEECKFQPSFQSTSLLRSTPFKNKDPLSKLTKNILNMSIECQEKNKEILSEKKLDALKDMLSNHKTVKIKPVMVTYRPTIKKRIERKTNGVSNLETEVLKKPDEKSLTIQHIHNLSTEPMPEKIVMEIPREKNSMEIPCPQPAFVPTCIAEMVQSKPSISNVARTLFTDEPKETANEANLYSGLSQEAIDTRIALKELLQNRQMKSENEKSRSVLKELLENKQVNNENTFMGQTICSPSVTNISLPVPKSASTPFVTKPIAGLNNMFNKFVPSPFAQEPKPQTPFKPKSDETGEPLSNKQDKDVQPIKNLFAMQPKPVATAEDTSNIWKTAALNFGKADVQNEKSSKENVPEDVIKPDEKTMKQFSFNFKGSTSQSGNNIFGSAISGPEKPAPHTLQVSEKLTEKLPTSSETPAAVPIGNPPAVPTEESQSVPTEVSTSVPTENPPAFPKDTPLETKLEEIHSTEKAVNLIKPTEKQAISSENDVTKRTDPPLFSVPSSQSTLTTQSGSVFGTPSATFSFGSPGSIFSTTTSPNKEVAITPSEQPTSDATSLSADANKSPTLPEPDVCANSPNQPSPETAQSVFSSTPSSIFATTTSHSVFGADTSTSQASIFGTPNANKTPLFGTQTSAFNTLTSEPSVSVAATVQSSIFGSTTPTTQSAFGSPTTTSSSIFGLATPTTQASIFGTATPTSQTSIFGTTTTTQASIFGTATPTTQASIFGTPTQATQASVFGTPPANSQASVFSPPTASVFGTPSPQSIFASANQASVFGGPTTTTDGSSGSIFGGTETLFAAASISTGTVSPSSGGNIFGENSSGTVFGDGSSKNIFGQPKTEASGNIFGGSQSFGQKPATDFWSGAAKSIEFGSSPGFGQQQATTPSSVFGSGSFSATSPGGAFGSPTQPSSAFGAAPAFGGSPVFGTRPVFGQSSGFGSPSEGSGFGGAATFGGSGFGRSPNAGFGASPSFGANPTFGSNAFGNTSSGFGAPTQSNARFESLATQNTLTFGNLAQQSEQRPQQTSSFNTSPSFTGWRG